MPDKLVFSSAIEGLYVKGLGARVTPTLKAALKQTGLDLDRPIPPGLGRDAWYAGLAEVVRHLYPAAPIDDAHQAIGRAMMEGVTETFWGRAMTPAVRLLGVKRVLLRLPSQMRATNNFSNGTVTVLGPTALELKVEDVGDAPGMLQGSLQQLALWAGAASATVEVDARALPAATYVVQWTER